jgi:hypothetical protein
LTPAELDGSKVIVELPSERVEVAAKVVLCETCRVTPARSHANTGATILKVGFIIVLGVVAVYLMIKNTFRFRELVSVMLGTSLYQ